MILMIFGKKSNFLWENGRGRHSGAKGSGVSRPDQKVGPLGGLFASAVISKTCFTNLEHKPPLISKDVF